MIRITMKYKLVTNIEPNMSSLGLPILQENTD